ncbi:MAG: hypothetical protein JXA21_00150 [Anaerolineae bacterium]|nr:hypothetical protein [Anaerolineae bacterium]
MIAYTPENTLVPESERPLQHPGLITLVSAGTRKDKTGPQAAEVAIDYHLGRIPILPAPAAPAEGIPPDLLQRIKKILPPTGAFASDDILVAQFTDARISPWRLNLPQAGAVEQRIQQVVDFLYKQFSADRGAGQGSENALVLFLRVLSECRDRNDWLHQELEELAESLAAIARPPTVSGGAPLRHCWLIASGGERGSQPQAHAIQARYQSPALTIEVEVVYDAFGIQETYQLVSHLYRQKIAKAGLRTQDVIADLTGSTKPMSAGMMLACAQIGAPMQYMYGDLDHLASVPRLVAFSAP